MWALVKGGSNRAYWASVGLTNGAHGQESPLDGRNIDWAGKRWLAGLPEAFQTVP